MFTNIFNTNTTAFKQTAFTIIELLVVIVIIGILSTVSVATFSSQKSQPLIAKYQAEKNQAAKLHFEECKSAGFNHCGPSFTIYFFLGNIFKKDIPSPADDPGDLIFDHPTDHSASFSVHPDGKSFFYTAGSNLYQKEFNSDPLVHGTLLNSDYITNSINISPDGEFLSAFRTGMYYHSLETIGSTSTSGTSGAYSYNTNANIKPSITPDGRHLLFVDARDGNNLRKINTNRAVSAEFDAGTTLGEVIHNNVSLFTITRDQQYILYQNPSDNRIYKKRFNAPPAEPGTLFLNQASFRYAQVTHDDNYLLYEDVSNGYTYLKPINDTDPDNPGILFLEESPAGHFYKLFP